MNCSFTSLHETLGAWTPDTLQPTPSTTQIRAQEVYAQRARAEEPDGGGDDDDTNDE